MVKFLEIWCLNNYGIPLFYQKDNSRKVEREKDSDTVDDAQLISGLFSAVQTMGESIFDDDIITIELKRSKLIFNKGEKISVIAKVSNSENKESARIALDEVTKRFISEFDDILDDWMGETLIFAEFADKISEYCTPHPPKKKKTKKKTKKK